MSRTISSTLIVPRDQALPRAEILDVRPPGRDGGLAVVATAVNTLADHHRATLVDDWCTEGILTGLSQVARYRPRTPIGEGWTGESAEVWLYVALTTLTTGHCAITVREVGGGTSVAYTTTVSRSGYVYAGALSHDDSAEYLDLEIEITTLTAFTAAVYGIQIVPHIARSTLPAAPWASGVLPLDLAHIDGECPLSVARLRDMHALASSIAARRGTAFAAARPRGYIAGALSVPVFVDLVVSAGAAQVKVWIYGSTGALTTTLLVSVDGDTAPVTLASGWQSVTLDLLPTTREPRHTSLTVAYTVAGGGHITHISAYLL